MMLFVGLLWDGYSLTGQTPSELSAIGAPTRSLWMVLGTIYGTMMLVFGVTIWRSPRPKRGLRLAGLCIAAFMVWVAVLATTELRAEAAPAPRPVTASVRASAGARRDASFRRR